MTYVIFSLIGLGILFSLARLIIGPSVLDRIVSLDTINIMITGLVALMALIFENSMYLDIAIVYGVLAFLETIILAKYMEAKV